MTNTPLLVHHHQTERRTIAGSSMLSHMPACRCIKRYGSNTQHCSFKQFHAWPCSKLKPTRAEPCVQNSTCACMRSRQNLQYPQKIRTVISLAQLIHLLAYHRQAALQRDTYANTIRVSKIKMMVVPLILVTCHHGLLYKLHRLNVS
jgi:hypothetical protein